jgi:hypothetical protein
MKQALRLGLVLVLLSLLAVPVLAQGTTTIDFGDTVESALDNEHPTREYSFEGEAGQTVTITLNSDDYDPLLVLLDADGQEVAMNDDGGSSGLNSQIGPFTLSETGEYTIVADSYSHYFNNSSSSTVGSFTLRLEAIDIRRIEYTQQVKGELATDQPTAYYQFRGQEGDVVNIVVGTDGFGASVELSQMAPEDMGIVLISGTDYSGAGMATIGGYALPETTNYLLVVRSSSGDLGEFTLSVDKVDVTPLAFDEPVTLSFDTETVLAYLSFEAEAGDVVSLTVKSDGTFDTTMTLNGPDGYQVGYVDDTYGLDPALVNQILTQSGLYTVIVKPYSQGGVGEVELRLEQSELASLDDGPLTLALSSNQTRDTVTYSANAGDVVRLTLETQGEATSSPNVTVMQSQQTVAYASGSTVKRLSIDFTVPLEGTLYIQIDDYTYADLTLLVSAEVLGQTAAEPAAVVTETVEDELAATPTPAVLPTDEASAETEEPEGLIEPTEEPIVEATAAATEPATATEEPAPATEEPAPAETAAPDAEATEAA